MAPNGEKQPQMAGSQGKSWISNSSSSGSKAGLNHGKITDDLYRQAREKVLERVKETEGHLGQTMDNLRMEGPHGKHRNYHYIHGKAYDLRTFFDKHPGGADILKMTMGELDATPLFESYHAFANREYILRELEKYRVTECPCGQAEATAPMYSFKEDGFYRVLTKRVRAHFGANSESQSVTRAVKANGFWAVKVSMMTAIHLMLYFGAFGMTTNSTGMTTLLAFAAGFTMIMVGFTAMHDSSHFAVGAKNKYNQVIMSLWCAWAGWNSKAWMIHHAVRHHAYTGNIDLDPDLYHFLPLINKHPDTREVPRGLLKIVGDSINGTLSWGVGLVMFYLILPGMFVGQCAEYLLYARIGHAERTIWKLPRFDQVEGYHLPFWEKLLFLFQIYLQYQRGSFPATLAYLVACNIAYAICIVADHDLVESALTNHIDVDIPQLASATAEEPEGEPNNASTPPPDWGEVQVRNSTDFVNDRWAIFANLFGSINYQIEHHLFPGINHQHLPGIAPIVQQTCQEFGIPYTTYDRIQDAWFSYLLVVKSVMTGIPVEEDAMFTKLKNE